MSTITQALPMPSPVAPTETTVVAGDDRGVMRGVSWDLYERLVDGLDDHTTLRLAYDGKDIEVMVVGPIHDRLKELIGIFIHEVSFGLEVDCRAQGSTTWKRAALRRGIEADQCYYFDPDKLAASDRAVASDTNDVADYPNPDLAVEIDLSPSAIDRPGIYAALAVFEVWRFHGKTAAVTIEQLRPDGAYTAAAASRFLHVRPDEVARWLTDGQAADRRNWVRRLREWVQDVLRPRAGGEI